MEVTALLLSRLQFAFTISFHIIFPSFSIGLAAWLTILEALYQTSHGPLRRRKRPLVTEPQHVVMGHLRTLSSPRALCRCVDQQSLHSVNGSH